jgi:hypothetical protein
MRVDKIALLVALPVAMNLAAAGLAVAESAEELKGPPQPSAGVASPQGPGQAVSPPAGDPAAVEIPAAPEEGAVAPAEGAPGAGGEPAAEGTETGEAAEAGTAEGAGLAEGAQEKEPEKEPTPVTGAFGIPLGERFDPCLVAKVLGEEPVTYRDADKSERKGTRYRVEPKVPNMHFNAYSVETTGDGVIYAIRGDHEPAAKESKCGVTKDIAASLEEKYGKPRGRSPFGHWYAFRDMSVEHYRGIRLYANRCRRGIYQILYGDDGVKGAPPPAPPEPGATSGL